VGALQSRVTGVVTATVVMEEELTSSFDARGGAGGGTTRWLRFSEVGLPWSREVCPVHSLLVRRPAKEGEFCAGTGWLY